MTKFYSFIFVLLSLLTLGSCQSIEQISIDYMNPGELSFPTQLRKVAIVNNVNTTPDNKLIATDAKQSSSQTEIHAVAYANGDPKTTTESLAQEIAHQNYFDEVVICDSVLRAHDHFPRENKLSQEEVQQLASDLGVDFIIALENLQFKADKKAYYLPEFNCYRGVVDVKVYPTIRVYLPQRNGPMSTLQLCDSIFWENFDPSISYAISHMIPDQQILKESAEFAGTVPVKQLLPYWTKGSRYLFTGGTSNMRDAAIYVRENNWEHAYKLWDETFKSTKSNSKKMQTALNIALYHEMKDSLEQARIWATKAQQFAKVVDKVDKKPDNIKKVIPDDIPNFYITTLYLSELEKRINQSAKLNMQMNRFNDDF